MKREVEEMRKGGNINNPKKDKGGEDQPRKKEDQKKPGKEKNEDYPGKEPPTPPDVGDDPDEIRRKSPKLD